MCFRPAEEEVPPVICPNCGRMINRIAGVLPKKCPFCKTSTEGLEDAPAAAPTAPGAPAVPGAPGAPAAPGAPKAPTHGAPPVVKKPGI